MKHTKEGQSRFLSAVEVASGTLLRMVVAVCVTQSLAYSGLVTITIEDNAIITVVLTATSLVLSFILRRFFNGIKR